MVKVKYRKEPPYNINFDFEDIASGNGYVLFWAMIAETSAGQTQLLSTNQLYSVKIETKRTTNGTTTLNFTTPAFSRSVLLKGTFVLSCGVGSAGSGAKEIKAKLQDWNGSSATDITSQIQSQSVGATAPEMIILEIPLTSKHQIKKNNQLRLNIEFITAGAGGPFYLGHDPVGRDGEGTEGLTAANDMTTQMKLFVPFDI